MSGRDSPKIVIEKRKIDGNDGSVQAPAGARASRESRQDTRTDKKLYRKVNRSTPRCTLDRVVCHPKRGEGGGDDAARREPSTHRAFTHLQKWVST